MAVIFDSLLLDAICVLLTLFTILYFYMTRNFGYWEKKGVHAIPPTPFLGSSPGILLLRESIGCWFARKYKETAGMKFFGAYFMDKPVLVVRDLELVKNVLMKDAQTFLDRTFTAQDNIDPMVSKNLFGLKGKKWRHLRVKLTPTFTSGKKKKMFYLVDECGKQLASCLGQAPSSGGHVHVKEIMARYSTDVIASCAFGLTTNAQVNPNCDFRSVLKRVFERESLLLKLSACFVFILPNLMKIFSLKTIESDVEELVRKMFCDVLGERKKTGNVRNNFIDLMIKLKDEGEIRSHDANDLEEIQKFNKILTTASSSPKKITHSSMDDDDYVAQAFVFLAAGFETSSSVLNYCLYELALNPDIQDKLRSEINKTRNKNNGKLSYEEVTRMNYLEMVAAETLRKYPTLAFIDRVCNATYKIPGTEVVIEKDTQVFIPILGIHTDPQFYPEPEKYDPERFSVENKNSMSQYAHIPFGEGPRVCIGMRFGQMQVKTALVHVLASYEVRPCAETPKPPLHYKVGALTHSPEETIVLAFNKLP